MLQTRNLTNQIQFVLLSMDLPYQVSGTNGFNATSLNGTTSALFYGFKPDNAPECSIADGSTNSYAFSELPFSEALPDTAPTNSFLAVMLTDSNLAGAELILSRGVASDGSFPTQTVILSKTDDPARNVRYVGFDNAIFDTRLRGDYSMVRASTDSTVFTNLLGLETGLQDFDYPGNAFVPGAIADNLTSYGGLILVPNFQTPMLDFLDAGAAGSYGTVTEPCNYTQKFPNSLAYFYQARGFSLAEAYYQSILNPYLGLIVGEPLSAPFALRGTGIWEQLSAGTPALSGRTNLQLQFTAAATNLPLGQVDLFIDGTWFETITNLPPASGDVLSVTLNGLSNSYIVPANATLASAAGGLASILNTASNNTLVSATSFGDRIELRSLNPAVPGAGVTVNTGATNNTDSAATFIRPADFGFLDSIAEGYHYLFITNNPAVGDWLQLVVTKTNGGQVTLSVTNGSSGTTIGNLLMVLFDEVNSTPALQSPDGIYAADYDDYAPDGWAAADWNLYAQSPGWAASAVQVRLNTSPDLVVLPPGPSLLQDNLSDLQPRNHLYVSSGRLSLPVEWTLDTTQLQDGYHELTAVAYEGTSVRTQTQVTQEVRIQNTGLSASLNTLVGASNTDLGTTLQFSVVAGSNNVSSIELFTTGGPLGTVLNQSTAFFSVPGTNLGVGLHPFYAIVTDTADHQYRTATTWIRLNAPLEISVTYPPLTLSWTSVPGRSYSIFTTTHIRGPFQLAATVTPSTFACVWVDTNSSVSEKFYAITASY